MKERCYSGCLDCRNRTRRYWGAVADLIATQQERSRKIKEGKAKKREKEAERIVVPVAR